jgi:uncharacterized protein
MLPVRRDLQFPLDPHKACDWHPEGPAVSLFFNTLSLFFPHGERFFIHSVRHYRDRITDPELQQAVTAFIGQEAMHGREHEDYNALCHAAGLPVKRQEARVYRLLERAKRRFPALQLSVTIALEHLTAIMANALLSRPQLIDGADAHYKALWNWHALEETEHKAVAFDVYRAAVGTGFRAYLLRALGLISATFMFWSQFYVFYTQNLIAAGHGRNGRIWWQSFRWQWLAPAAMLRLIPGWLDYFRPGFHPWDQDNRHLLARMDEVVAPYSPRATAGVG